MHSLKDQARRVLPGTAIRRVGWRHSLRTRMALSSTLTSIALTAGITVVAYLGMRGLLQQNVREEVSGLARQTALALEATLDSVQISGKTLAMNAAGIGRDPLELRTLLVSTVHADPDIFGAMLIIEPGRLAPDDPGFTWYVRRGVDGRLHETTMLDLRVDYPAEAWYIRTVTTDAAWWSEPAAANAFGGSALTTYRMALRTPGTDGSPGTAIGLVGLDVPVARLRTQLGAVPQDSNLRAMLLSPERLYVLHPDEAVRMRMTLDDLVHDGRRSDLEPFLAAVREHLPIELEHVTTAPSDGAETGERRFSVGIPVHDTGWTLVVSAADAFVLQRLNDVTLYVVLAGLTGVLLCVVAMRRTSRAIAHPIEDLTNSARHLGRGDFDYPLRHTEREDEVGVMARAFDRARNSLRDQMREIADMGEARSRIDNELRIAAEIQLAMLPRGSEFDAGGSHLQLWGQLVPAKAVGGDFYNFFERDGDALWFVIGDVSDKGVPAAVFMARTMTVLEVAAQSGGAPGHALREAARHLIQGNDTCMFATVLCGVIELRTGMMSLASAAHEAPVLLRADGRRELLDMTTTAPLGVEVADTYPAWRGRLLPGDTLLTYTDGITEAFDRDNEPFGTQRLLDALDPALAPVAQCRNLVAAVQTYADGAPQSDDITVLAIRFQRDVRRRLRLVVSIEMKPPLPATPVGTLIERMDAALAPLELPATLIHDVHLVIEEVATNVFKYGSGDRDTPSLTLEARVDGSQLALEFVDDGVAFDPLAAPVPDLDADIDERPIGGLGVHLIRELAEHVAYTRNEDRNVLRVVLHIPDLETPR